MNNTIKNYLTDTTILNDVKYRICNFILFNCILQYLHHPDFKVDDKDISLISNYLNLENATENISNHFEKKYGEDKLPHYLEVTKTLVML